MIDLSQIDITGDYRAIVIQSKLFTDWLKSLHPDFILKKIKIDHVQFDEQNKPIFIKLDTITYFNGHCIPRILYLIGNLIVFIPLIKKENQIYVLYEEKPYIVSSSIDLVLPNEQILEQNISEKEVANIFLRHTGIAQEPSKFINIFEKLDHKKSSSFYSFPSPTDQRIFYYTTMIDKLDKDQKIIHFDDLKSKSKSVITKLGLELITEMIQKNLI